MTVIVLVRHAHPEDPRPGASGDNRRPLTAQGFRAARALITGLADLKPTVVASSPHRRAVQTVEPIAAAHGLGIRTDHALRGWESGVDPAMPGCASLYARNWADPSFAWPGYESLSEVTERAVAALTTFAFDYAGQTVIIGSHGTFITRALNGFGHTAADQRFVLAMPMPAIYRFDLDRNIVRFSGPGI